jgi:hypothetical protein
MKPLSKKETEMIERGKKHWELDVLSEMQGEKITSDTIRLLINSVLENTWEQAKMFYENHFSPSEENANIKVVHKQISYQIENKDDIKQIIKKQPKGWDAHNRSDVYENSHGKMQVDIYYRLQD